MVLEDGKSKGMALVFSKGLLAIRACCRVSHDETEQECLLGSLPVLIATNAINGEDAPSRHPLTSSNPNYPPKTPPPNPINVCIWELCFEHKSFWVMH
jgi:hypothetical protein